MGPINFKYEDACGIKRNTEIAYIEVFPTFEYSVLVDDRCYSCTIEKVMSQVWNILIFDEKGRQYHTCLYDYNDVEINTFQIFDELLDFNVSSAIAQSVKEIFNRYRGS